MNDQPTFTPHSYQGDSYTVTVLAPTPQDAKYCKEILREHGVPVEIVTSVYEAVRQLRAGTGVLLISQEFLTAEAMEQLRFAVEEQPSWSDIPILVLLAQNESSARTLTDLLALGHVTLMERPLRIALLVSTLKAKLRDRARQYEVRDLLLESQQASDAKSAFVANISHEIRTPMTAILGYAELMTNLINDEQAAKYLTTIRRNGNFLLGIINDILDLSKIEAGKFDIDIEFFDPTLVLEDVRSIMEMRASEKGLGLQVQYATEIPRLIQSDSKRLKQILINLIGNAIKFTKKGDVRVAVSFRSTPVSEGSSAAPTNAHSGHLVIEIIDSGIGITSDQQEHLFKPFSQGGSCITQQFGGTGLGLAISKRLAMMLDGDIRVDSTIHEGSTFTLTIATGNLNDMPVILPTTPSQFAQATPQATDFQLNAHILIVDDRRDIRFLSSHIVTNAGGQVTEAEDGIQAIEIVKHASLKGMTFDIILLDMQMPNLDGYQTAIALRKLGFTNPIVALTADAMQGDMTKCLTAGCNYHISKPINKFELLQLLRKLTATDSIADQSLC
jgi:two-component system, chemotaxis family, CheB/CheR fusion protein